MKIRRCIMRMINKKLKLIVLFVLLISIQIVISKVYAVDEEPREMSIETDYMMADSLGYYDGKFLYYYVSGTSSFTISRYNLDTDKYVAIYYLSKAQCLNHYTNGSIAYFLYKEDNNKSRIFGYDMKINEEVLNVTINSAQKAYGAGFVVSKKQNIYLEENKEILVFDKNGNKIQTLKNETGYSVSVINFDPEEKILFCGYMGWHVVPMLMENGKFVASEMPDNKTYVFYQWKFIDNDYAISPNGNIVKWNKDTGEYATVYRTGKIYNSDTARINPLYVNGNYIYTSTTYGAIDKFNMKTGIIEKSINIGTDYIIIDIYYYNDYLYIKYKDKNDTTYPYENYLLKIKEDTLKNTGKLPFKDVSETAWYHNAVKYVYENNIIKGYNDTTFAPNDKVTRGMLVTILYRMEGEPKVSGKPKFPDVQDSSKYYYKAVKWATDKQIVSGYSNGKFGPTDNIQRQQLAVILNKYAQYKGKDVSKTNNLKEYTDNSKISSYAINQMKWAVGAGVISGNENKQTGEKTLNPKGEATRAEVAAMMEKYCKNIGM